MIRDINTTLIDSTHHMSLSTIHTTIEALMDETLWLSLENKLVSELSSPFQNATALDQSLTAGAALRH